MTSVHFADFIGPGPEHREPCFVVRPRTRPDVKTFLPKPDAAPIQKKKKRGGKNA